MYRILIFTDHTWVVDDERYDCQEDARNVLGRASPWRIQEWIDIRNGPAEAGFWRDAAYWLDGQEHRATTERIS